MPLQIQVQVRWWLLDIPPVTRVVEVSDGVEDKIDSLVEILRLSETD